MSEAAKQRAESGFTQFDQNLAQLERELPNLIYNDIVKRLNALIAQLNPITENFQAIGGTGKPADVEAANGLITKYNDRMKKLEQMGETAKQNKPAAPVVTRQATQVTELPPPAHRQQPQQSAPQPVQEEVTFSNPTTVPLPQDARTAISTFNNLYLRYERLTPQDVWTGKSNDLVHAWGDFCQRESAALGKATGLRLDKDSVAQLKDVITKFNTFSNDLTAKINSLQISPQAQDTILRFGPDHDRAMEIFKSNMNTENRVVCESQYQLIQHLEKNLRDLRIDNHPTVATHLALCGDSLRKMSDVFSQMSAHEASEKQAQAQHYRNQQAQQQNVGFASRFDDPPQQSYEAPQEQYYQAEELPAPKKYAPPPLSEEPVEEVVFDLPPPKPRAEAAAPAAEPHPKFCPECGTQNAGKRFCGNCGYQFS